MTAPQPTAAAPRSPAARAFAARHPTGTAAAVCLLSFAAFWTAQRAARVSLIDLMVYRAEGRTVLHGGDLYAMVATHADLPTTYPPFAALLFAPLTWIGVPAMRTAATAANLALLIAVAHLSLRLLDRPRRLPAPAAALAVAAAAVWCEPVWTTLRYGQINLLLAALVLWDLTRPDGHRWTGAGIGVAAGIKLTPALFAVHLAAVGAVRARRALREGRGPWNPELRRAAVATATFAGTVVLAAVVLPADSRTFWTRMVFATGRVGHAEDTANQSLRGVLARALHSPGSPGPGASWAVAAAAVAALGLAAAGAAALAGERLPAGRAWAGCSCAVTGLLISPVSWSHHWVWCVPVVLLLADEALRRGTRAWRAAAVGAGLVFCSFALWFVPHGPARPELHQTVGQMLLSGVYPAAGLAFVVLAAVRAARAPRRS